MKVRAAIELAAHVAAKNATLPILTHVKIEGGRVSASDLSQQIDVPVELPPALKEAAFCVHGARLMRVLKALPDNVELDLATLGDRLVVTAGKTRYELNTLPVADFPQIDAIEPLHTDVEVVSKDLTQALNFVQPAAAIADIRYYLNGVHILIETSRIVLTATDGHRLHRVRVGIEPRSGEPVRGIIAGASIARVLEIAARHERVTLFISATRFGVEDDEILLTKLIDGQYPDADRVIPSSRPATAGVDRAALLAAIKRMAAIEPPAIGIDFTDVAIELTARNAAGEQAGEGFLWNAAGAKVKPVHHAYQVAYLLDALNAFTCARINLHIGGDKESLYLTDDTDGSHQIVLMPYRA
jgi:DNA polymerase-3 subunit beta